MGLEVSMVREADRTRLVGLSDLMRMTDSEFP
jgi:hypothetical protein